MPHMNHAFRPEFLATKQLNMLKKKKKKKQHFLAYYCDGTDAAKQILESSIFNCINNQTILPNPSRPTIQFRIS